MGKKNIGYDMCYRNTVNSTYLAKARTNSLQLEEHLGRGILNQDKKCKLCGTEEEDLEHFLVRCPELDLKRDPEILRMATPMTSEEQTIHILFEVKQYQKVAKIIRNMSESNAGQKYWREGGRSVIALLPLIQFNSLLEKVYKDTRVIHETNIK